MGWVVVAECATVGTVVTYCEGDVFTKETMMRAS